MSERPVVLIAEDDASDLLFLRQALLERCPGIELRDVCDGQEAVDYLSGAGRFADRKAFPLPDFIFLDVKMPRRSGLEVLDWMRQDERFRKIRVMVLSGSQLTQDRERAERLGAEYLIKPIGYAGLLELAERCCGRLRG